MAKKFCAVNRETGKRWEPDPKYHHQYLVMYDSGYLAVVTEFMYAEASIEPLDNKIWKAIIKYGAVNAD